jgi:SAM-dependent methyltransferase
MDMITENTQCLACTSRRMRLALDLGQMPLANAYKDSADQAEDRYPLAVNLCRDCFHLQLSHTVDPGIIYKNYMYATGTNNTIKEYCKWFAEFVHEYADDPGNVLDIGCNDGTQLDYFAELGYKTYGIDPAENLHDRIDKKHKAVCNFFGPDAVKELGVRTFDVIVAQNVFAHNPKPDEFLQTCTKLMNPGSFLFIQTSQADMVLNNEFDTIYHEHINFFNTASMDRLSSRCGLNLVDVFKNPIHGNSYIFVLSIETNWRPQDVYTVVGDEKTAGLYTTKTYSNWAKNVAETASKVRNSIEEYRSQGYAIVGYGAAAKGMTMINYANINLDFIVDDSPLKQGKFAPGMNTPIVPRSKIDTVTGNILFVPLAWNFYTEIRERIQSVRSNPGDRFLKYFPTVEVSK